MYVRSQTSDLRSQIPDRTEGYSTLEIASGLIIMNEHSLLAALQNKVPRLTIFVFVASGNVKLKFAVFNPLLIGTSFSSPWINFTSATCAFREDPGTRTT